MRRAAKIDANQPEIVSGLRDVGAKVLSLAAVGFGCPDLLVKYRGVLYLMEVKDPAKPPSKRRLTPDQVTFHKEWELENAVVKTLDDALRVIGAIK